MTATPLTTLVQALQHHTTQGQRARPPRAGDIYKWDCGCRFRYLLGDWHHEHLCARHAESETMLLTKVDL